MLNSSPSRLEHYPWIIEKALENINHSTLNILFSTKMENPRAKRGKVCETSKNFISLGKRSNKGKLGNLSKGEIILIFIGVRMTA